MRRARRKRPREEKALNYRRNRQIRVPKVMLVDQNNQNHGVVPTNVALKMATEAELDLVEVAPNARPPVVRIMDYSKFAYEKKRKDREARKNQKKIEIKTIKLKLKTSDFHRSISVKKATGWLKEGKKVKVEIRFYGREITYPELGRKSMDLVAKELTEFGTIEQRPQMEGRTMVMMIAPEVLPSALPKPQKQLTVREKKAAAAAAKKKREQEQADEEVIEEVAEAEEPDVTESDTVAEVTEVEETEATENDDAVAEAEVESVEDIAESTDEDNEPSTTS